MFSASVDEGLELRLLEPRHAETLFGLTDKNRERSDDWFPWVEGTKTVEDSEDFIRGALESFAKGNGFQTGIWFEGALAGVVGLHYISALFRSTEIGYWLGAEYEGRGIMTKACHHLFSYLFSDLELNRIEVRCEETNIKSRAIPERLGFTQEGKLRSLSYTRNGLVDVFIYGLLADEWQRKAQKEVQKEPEKETL